MDEGAKCAPRNVFSVHILAGTKFGGPRLWQRMHKILDRQEVGVVSYSSEGTYTRDSKEDYQLDMQEESMRLTP